MSMTATEIEQRKTEHEKYLKEQLTPVFHRYIHAVYHRQLRDIIAQQYLDGKPVGHWGWGETTRYGGSDD